MIIEGILLGILGNGAYDLVKSLLKDIFGEEDEDLTQRLYQCIEVASKAFFSKYQDEFGNPNSSFLARQENLDKILRSIYYGNDDELINIISPKGFDGAKDASKDSILYFVENLEKAMLNDFRLNMILTEKRHITESREMGDKIYHLLSQIVNSSKNEAVIVPDNKEKFTLTDGTGNKLPFKEGEVYLQKYPNGVQIEYMVKNGLIYVDFTDLYGQKAYYEVDFDGNVKNTKFPYDLSEYKIDIPMKDIISKENFILPNGCCKEIYKLKWDKSVSIVYDLSRKMQQLEVTGGCSISHRDKLIKIS